VKPPQHVGLTNHGRASKALGSLQHPMDVVHVDVERGRPCGFIAAVADSIWDPAILRCHHAVRRISAITELPAKQLATEPPKHGTIATGYFKKTSALAIRVSPCGNYG